MYQIFQWGGVEFNHSILYRLKSTCGKQCHPVSEKLLAFHTLDHNAKGRYKCFEVAVDAPHFFYKKGYILRFVLNDLFLLMQNQFKVQLRNLVVHDEDFLIGEMRSRYLKTEQGIQADI